MARKPRPLPFGKRSLKDTYEERAAEVIRRHKEFPDCLCDCIDVYDGTLCPACEGRTSNPRGRYEIQS